MPEQQKKTLIKLVLYTILLILAIYIAPRAIHFFAPFVIGWIVAWLATPMLRFFEKHFKVMRKHSTWLVIVITMTIVFGGCYIIISTLWREAKTFFGSMPEFIDTLMSTIYQLGDNLSATFPFIPADLSETMGNFIANMDSYLGNVVSSLGGPTLNIVGNIPNILALTIFTFLASYFFIADKEKLTEKFHQMMPTAFFEKWNWVKNMFSKAVGGYFVAQFKIMAIIAVIVFAGLMLLDVEFAILWAVIIAFMDFLPFFGTGFVIWPWSVYEILVGNFGMVAGLMLIYLVCLFVHQILQPKFVGNTVGMDSFSTLVFMFIGYRISSVLGMIIAIPIGIILMNLHKEGAFDGIIQEIKDLLSYIFGYLKREENE